jgi:hypothetical protein
MLSSTILFPNKCAAPVMLQFSLLSQNFMLKHIKPGTKDLDKIIYHDSTQLNVTYILGAIVWGAIVLGGIV